MKTTLQIPTGTLPSRRAVIGGLGVGAAVIALESHRITAALADTLEPGDFIWRPDLSPTGPVAIIVSLPEQRVYVYRNGIEIAVSTCSTGKKGHGTPTGVFTILQKDKHHRSSTYNNAPMPNMNRLTWQGIALHAGNLPGYPASHGCIRLPMEFSELLFGITHLGTPVIIADNHSAPADVVHPGQVLSAYAQAEFDHVAVAKKNTSPGAHPVNQISMAPAAADVPTPRFRPHDYEESAKALAAAPVVPSTTILVSSADSRIMVLDNGEIVAEGTATIADPETPLGHHLFVLSSVNDADRLLHWHTIGYGNAVGGDVGRADLATIERIRGPHEVIEAIRTRMHPGTMMVTVDQPLHEDSRSAEDFVVMTSDLG